ncbi:hypothetical protein VP01_1180g2 [Puccinia sorghi]|uniref:Uncharacterized protein n=1 Tax=Puccinia sorghi TaxID=27349 RepID=A0A0L6VR33_9BASI|nr:hypothetical protein VP01_1180g2 [Puccinia sorghi]
MLISGGLSWTLGAWGYQHSLLHISYRGNTSTNSQSKFSLAQSPPKQYQRIISNINSHSHDEYTPKKRNHTIKMLKFFSENATKLFCRLDAAMLASNDFKNKNFQIRLQVPPPTPQESHFLQTPIALPLGFYKPRWFNEYPSRRLKLLIILLQKFHRKEILSHEIENAPDDEESTEKGDSSYVGQEEDLDKSSGEDDKSVEEQEEDQQFVDHSMETLDTRLG